MILNTGLDNHYRYGSLSVVVEINDEPAKQEAYSLWARLFDIERNVVFDTTTGVEEDSAESNYRKVEFNRQLSNPLKWSGELSYLYTLVMQLKDENGKSPRIISETVGFREVEIKNSTLFINGVLVKLSGVNHHDWHPVLGNALTSEIMLKDIQLMKQFNLLFSSLGHPKRNIRY